MNLIVPISGVWEQKGCGKEWERAGNLVDPPMSDERAWSDGIYQSDVIATRPLHAAVRVDRGVDHPRRN